MEKTIRYLNWRNILLLALLIVCALELRVFVNDAKDFYRSGELYLNYQHGLIVRESDLITPNEIAPWMTFAYINFIFKLPPDYLKNTLHLAGSLYPNIQITRYARINQLNTVQLLASVKQAVTLYKP